MKRFKYIIISLCALSLVACSEPLVKEPLSSLNKSILFSTIENAESAVLGVYYDVSLPWSNNYPYVGNYATDEAVATWSGTTAYFSGYKGNYTSGSKDVYTLWKRAYKTIVDANACVINIPKIEGSASEEQKNKLVAEARFLRAFTYFDLVQIFGPVPLYLSETNGYSEDLFVGRTPVGEIMEQVIADAEFAYNHLPASTQDLGGRASKWAAAVLLAKVYMLQGGHFIDSIDGVTPDSYFANGDEAKRKASYEKAVGYLLDVEQNSWHDLMTVADNDSFMDYGRIFLKSSRNVVAKEIIFDIQFSGPTRESDWGKRSISGSNKYYPELGYYYLWGQGNATSSFALSYDDNDVRFKWNIGPYTVKRVGDNIVRTPTGLNAWVHAKFRTENTTNSQGALVYRYADVLLMLAEVVNELANGPSTAYNATMPDGTQLTTATAYEYINTIRRRAHVPEIDDAHLNAFNPADGATGLVATNNHIPIESYGWIYRANILKNFESGTYYTPRHVYYNKTTNDRTGAFKELFLEALQMERAWELCFERHRWFDLKRWNIWYERASKVRVAFPKLTNAAVNDPIDKSALSVLNFNANPYITSLVEDVHRYLPIPVSEIMVNENLNPNNNGY